MTLPTDAAARKAVPIYSGFVKYFPLAMAEVAQLSRIGNEQHNPGKPLHWDRSKSGDELDAAMRHLLEAGAVDVDGVRHSTKLAWRAMANLEKELEGAKGCQLGAPGTDNQGWVEWDCSKELTPDIARSRIEVRLRSGRKLDAYEGGVGLCWGRMSDAPGSEIVAYRIVE